MEKEKNKERLFFFTVMVRNLGERETIKEAINTRTVKKKPLKNKNQKYITKERARSAMVFALIASETGKGLKTVVTISKDR